MRLALDIAPVTLHLSRPIESLSGTVSRHERLLVRVTASDGSWGLGEIAPHPVLGIPLKEAYGRLRKAAAEVAPLPDISCATLAIHDRVARARGVPLWVALDVAPPAAEFATVVTFGEKDDESLLRCIHAEPVRAIKLKLPDAKRAMRLLPRLFERVSQLVALDANGGWTESEAVELVRALEPHRERCLWIEQPCAVGRLTRRLPTSVPVYADESAIAEWNRDGVFDGVIVKPARDGFDRTLLFSRAVRRTGLEVVVGCHIQTLVTTRASLLAFGGQRHWHDFDSLLLTGDDPFAEQAARHGLDGFRTASSGDHGLRLAVELVWERLGEVDESP